MKTKYFVVCTAALVYILAAIPAGSDEAFSDFGAGIHYNVPLDFLGETGFDTGYLS